MLDNKFNPTGCDVENNKLIYWFNGKMNYRSIETVKEFDKLLIPVGTYFLNNLYDDLPAHIKAEYQRPLTATTTNTNGVQLTGTGAGNTLSAFPDILPFPIDCLPIELQQYVNECTQHLNFHHDFISVATLLMYGFTIRKSCALEVKSKWIERPSLFCTLVAPSGTGKTHPIEYALQPLRKIDAENYNQYKQELQQFELLDKQERINNIRPSLKQVLLNDTTIESLAKVHSQNPQGVVIVRDEMASWLQDFNKYRSGSDESQWLSIWNGIMIKVTRASKDEPIVIDNPCVSVVGTMQPALLPMFANNGRSVSGFIDRMLFVFPDDVKARYPSETEPDDTILNVYEKSIADLFSITENKRYVMKFDSDGRKLFNEYQRQNADAINATSVDAEKSLIAKLDNHVLRIAICLQAAFWQFNHITDLDIINGDVMSKAVTIAEWFKRHAYKVRHELYNKLASDDKTQQVKALKDNVGLSFRDIEQRTGISRSTAQRLYNS